MTRALTILAALLLASSAYAQEFRAMNRIASPGKAPEGAVALDEVQAVPRAVVEKGVQELMASWNTGQLEKHLAENFYDKSRLDDAISTNMPRDAKLTVLGIQGQQTLQQFKKDNATISRVSVTVRTRLEYNDPARGRRSFEGTNEYILRVTDEGNG
ncbi:MAG: hypothetical protein J0L97_05375 [Alphaproteobacteria bacterium]|nr:hypothetical protein [Alphaproteobacteria bacterium]